jgi:hypothetical protein
MQNIQLTAREAVKVFLEIGTERILGFAPEQCRPLFTGFRYTEKILLHARDIERYMALYRDQQHRDAEEATYRQVKRESTFRKSLRAAVVERNQHVDQFNRDLNNLYLKLNDERYDRMMAAKAKPEIHGMAEASETPRSRDNAVQDFALASPQFRNPGDMRATGHAVPGDMAKIVHDKITQ